MYKDKVLQITSTLLDEGYDAITLIREYPQNEEHLSITVGIESPIDRDDFELKEGIMKQYGVYGRILPTFDGEGNPATIMVFENE